MPFTSIQNLKLHNKKNHSFTHSMKPYNNLMGHSNSLVMNLKNCHRTIQKINIQILKTNKLIFRTEHQTVKWKVGTMIILVTTNNYELLQHNAIILICKKCLPMTNNENYTQS